VDLYSTFIVGWRSKRSLVYGSRSFTCNLQHTCLYFLSNTNARIVAGQLKAYGSLAQHLLITMLHQPPSSPENSSIHRIFRTILVTLSAFW